MSQSVKLTGVPVSMPRLIKEFMGKEKNAVRVYAFEMFEGGSNTTKSLPRGDKIKFTVLVNERQLKKAEINATELKKKRILVQGELVMDIGSDICQGELAVTCTILQVIPDPKADNQDI